MYKQERTRSPSSRVGVSIEHLLDGIARAHGDAGVSTAVVKLLEPLDFEVQAIKSSYGDGRTHAHDLRYVLTVHHRGAQTLWKHHRSFDEYEAFQKRVLHELHHGHFCSGGCPWLESSIAAAFETTKRSLLATMSTVIERRRRTTLDVMQAHRRFLVNRANHTCLFTLHHVARVFLEFIYGGVIDSSHVMGEYLHSATIAPPVPTQEQRVRSGSITKKAQRRLNAQSAPALVEEQVKTDTTVAEPTLPPTQSASTGAQLTALRPNVTGGPDKCTICEDFLPVKDIYVVRLSCGHRFHDECALLKLNQQLKCPTCHTDIAQFA